MIDTAGPAVSSPSGAPFHPAREAERGRRFTVVTISNRATAALRRLLPTESPMPSNGERGRVDELARRVERLEAALEGLQDAVYRQDVVRDRQIADLRHRHPIGHDPGSPELRSERP
jgi:hypothetical protein